MNGKKGNIKKDEINHDLAAKIIVFWESIKINLKQVKVWH